MKPPSLSIEGLGVCFSVLGFFGLTYGTKSVDRDAFVEASLRVGGITFPLGLLLLFVASIRSDIRRHRETLRQQRGFEVLPKATTKD